MFFSLRLQVKVEKVGEGLGGPTCEDPEPGHLEGFLTPSPSPRPKVSPESPAEQQA